MNMMKLGCFVAPIRKTITKQFSPARSALSRELFGLRFANPVGLAAGFDKNALYLTELEGEDGRKYVRISTPIGPLTGMDAKRCLRFNWEQRVGYLAVSDLDGSPYLHLCENRPYELLSEGELDRLIQEIGPLGDELEKAISAGGDAF